MTKGLPLLRLEVRRLTRAPLTWIVLALLFAAMLVAAMTGVARVRAEEATLARIATEERQSLARAGDDAPLEHARRSRRAGLP